MISGRHGMDARSLVEVELTISHAGARMAKKNEPVRPKQDSLASEIDALLKKLPGAEPDLVGGGTAPARPAAGSAPGPGAMTPSRPRPAAGASPPGGGTRLAVWSRVALGALFGIALTQWPYRHDCGWGLLGYGAAVSVMLVVAGWCAITTWRQRSAVAHVVSLVMGFWGIVLAAEVLLPRIGYASDGATWRCPVPAAAPAPRRVPPPPAATSQPPAIDGAALPSAQPAAQDTGGAALPPDSTPG